MKTAIQALIMIAAAAAGQAYGQATETTPPVPAQESPEVLNQGPIHEGYAQPLDLTPQAGIVSPAEPPAEIVENPAAERPKGSEFVWIPGYWAWDTDRNDHVWVSGCAGMTNRQAGTHVRHLRGRTPSARTAATECGPPKMDSAPAREG